jgi:hypothetical protein
MSEQQTTLKSSSEIIKIICSKCGKEYKCRNCNKDPTKSKAGGVRGPRKPKAEAEFEESIKITLKKTDWEKLKEKNRPSAQAVIEKEE